MAYMIKRYANRKLYDPQASQYVTLRVFSDLVCELSDVGKRQAWSITLRARYC